MHTKPHPKLTLLSGEDILDLEHPDTELLIRELVRSKKDLMIAQRQFDMATDPALVDHVVFRLGAAERQFRYLLSFARAHNIATDGVHPLWTEGD